MNRSYDPAPGRGDAPADEPRPEAWFRDLLAGQLGGQTEARLPFGIADVLTGDCVFEVEPAYRWRTGVRQALAYGAAAGRPPAVALYGDPHLAPAVLRSLQELPPPGVILWWFTGQDFARIASEEDAVSVPASATVRHGTPQTVRPEPAEAAPGGGPTIWDAPDGRLPRNVTFERRDSGVCVYTYRDSTVLTKVHPVESRHAWTDLLHAARDCGWPAA